MSLGKDGRLVGTEIDSLSELKNDPFLLLLSDEQNDYMELEDNLLFSSNNSSSSSFEQELPLVGFNFSLCLIPEVILLYFYLKFVIQSKSPCQFDFMKKKTPDKLNLQECENRDFYYFPLTLVFDILTASSRKQNPYIFTWVKVGHYIWATLLRQEG